jgi:hypothetical protein
MRAAKTTRLLIVSGLFGGLFAGLSACKTAPPKPDAPPEGGDSGVDIVYSLGHGQHRFVAESAQGAFHARQFYDRATLKEAEIDRAHYLDFLAKASAFVQAPRREVSAEHPSCRMPFTVTVHIAGDTKTTTGCRTGDDGGIGKLVKDGEFLLYSRK